MTDVPIDVPLANLRLSERPHELQAIAFVMRDVVDGVDLAI
jgi:hypothetical protein